MFIVHSQGDPALYWSDNRDDIIDLGDLDHPYEVDQYDLSSGVLMAYGHVYYDWCGDESYAIDWSDYDN